MLKKTLITATILAALIFTVAQLNVSIRDLIGTSLPATCSVGQRYFKTNATAGQNLYGCTATNTWNVLGDGGGSGGWGAPLESKTASSSASLNFTSCISSSYDAYMIQITDLLPATNGTAIGIRFSTDGGSNWVATNYSWSAYATAVGSAGANGSTSDVKGYFTSNQASASGNYPYAGTLYLYNPLGTTNYKVMTGTSIGVTSTASLVSWTNFITNPITTAVNAFQIIPQNGNIASGTARCYGIPK